MTYITPRNPERNSPPLSLRPVLEIIIGAGVAVGLFYITAIVINAHIQLSVESGNAELLARLLLSAKTAPWLVPVFLGLLLLHTRRRRIGIGMLLGLGVLLASLAI